MSSARPGDFVIPLLTVLSDAIGIEAAFLFSYALRFRTTLFGSLGYVEQHSPPISGYILGSLVVVFVWLMLFQSRGMYRARRNVNLSDEPVSVVKVVSPGMLVVTSAAFFYRVFSYSRIVFGLLWVLSIVLIVGGRAVTEAFERSLYRRGKHLRHAIIIGNRNAASDVFTHLHHHASFGIVINGYFSENPAPSEEPLASIPWLGPLVLAPDYVRKHRIELAFLALPTSEQPALLDLISECEGINIEFMMVPDVLGVLTSQVK